jgi:hypothetical protein
MPGLLHLKVPIVMGMLSLLLALLLLGVSLSLSLGCLLIRIPSGVIRILVLELDVLLFFTLISITIPRGL